MSDTDFLFPLLDWLALLLCLAGALLGAWGGLPRAFALLLWTLAALWLGRNLSAHLAGWMPNSVDPSDPAGAARLQRAAFLVVVGLVLAVPVLGRLLGGAGGKKKARPATEHRGYGAVAGLATAVLLVAAGLHLLRPVPGLGAAWSRAAAPPAAAAVADNAAWLYPDAVREALRAGK